MQLQTEYGDPKETNKIGMGINLPADAPLVPAGTIFDVNDPKSYSASASVTIFDNMGNPKSASIFYIKTQDPSNDDPTFKYDTRMFVDGEEITPELTRATDNRGTAQFIDRFGQKTSVPPDPAYILEVKDHLYTVPMIWVAQKNRHQLSFQEEVSKHTLLMAKRLKLLRTQCNLKVLLRGMQQTVLLLRRQLALLFKLKEFLLVDVDGSGPVSVDIPPGMYNGVELAKEVENALRDAFGDDKKIQADGKYR